MTDVVAIAFTPAPTSDSPNLRTASNEGALQTFHRLIELCFASIRRWNPSVRLVLVTSTSPGLETETRLRGHEVEILMTPFAHRPPSGFYGSFNASLFSIDAMAALAQRYAPGTRIALVDPDVVCTGPLTTLFEGIPDDGFLAYDADYPLDHEVQSLSRRMASVLHAELQPNFDGRVPAHYGGELYGFTPEAWERVADRVDEAWEFSLDRWRRGRTKFVTEEHLLNYALRYVNVASAQGLIRRIWTAPTHRTVRRGDALLPLWHLPAEKHRGLKQLHAEYLSPDSWFWSAEAEAWRLRAARMCGLGSRRPVRWIRDSTGSRIRTAQRALERLSAKCLSDQPS